jgi:hypothetical protein
MKRTVTALGAAGAALLAAAALTAWVPISTAAPTTDRNRASYEDTLRLWLIADDTQKAAACEAVQGGPDHHRLHSDGLPAHDGFDAEFLVGRC